MLHQLMHDSVPYLIAYVALSYLIYSISRHKFIEAWINDYVANIDYPESMKRKLRIAIGVTYILVSIVTIPIYLFPRYLISLRIKKEPKT